MKKEFINPELEVLRFQKGADVLLTSPAQTSISVMSSGSANSSQSLSRGIFDDSED